MGASHRVRVTGLPAWLDHARLLGAGDWRLEDDDQGARVAEARLPRAEAADLQARLRKLGLAGTPLEVRVEPPLPRSAVRAARAADAVRRRNTTPGFGRRQARAQGEGRFSLTPEALAMVMASQAAGREVVDVCAGAGGNTLAFARAGCRVQALEPDPARRAELVHNLRVYGVQRQVRVRPERLQQAAASLSGDLLFADPPWGADYDRLRCGPEAIPLLGEVLRLAPRFAECWLKLPPSFDVSGLSGARVEALFGEAEGDFRRVKFLWVRLGGPT